MSDAFVQAEQVDLVAAELGIDLMPWQREVAGRLLAGERVEIMRPRQHGRSELRRLLVRIAAVTEPSTEAP